MDDKASRSGIVIKRKRVSDARSPDKPGLVRSGRSRSIVEWAAILLFTAVVVAVPFPFGSLDLYIVSAWCIALSVALALATLLPLDRRRTTMLLALASVALCCVGVFAIQLSPGNRLAQPDAVWAEASKVLGTPLTPSLSIIRWQPLFACGPITAVILTVAVSLFVGKDLGTVRLIYRILAWSGLLYAIYGIFSAVFTPGTVLWIDRPAYQGRVVGTFTLANTAATFFGCHMILWGLQLLETLRTILPPGTFTWKRLNRRVLEKPTRAVVVPFTGFSICLVALLMTGSRAGTVISLAVALGCVLFLFWNEIPRVGGRGKLIAGAVVGVLLFLQIFGGTVSNRFDVSGLDDEGRFEIMAATTRIIADHPWFGTGLGTFVSALPAYRPIPPDISARFDRAYNTPLELASEVGLPLTIVIAALIVVGLTVIGRRMLVAERSRTVLVAAFATSTIALVHSLIDYPLQIPGVAVTVFAIGGLGLAQALRPRPARRDPFMEPSPDPDGAGPFVPG